jgi:hypothetical protein
MTDLDYVTLDAESAVARQTIIGCWMPNKNEIRMTSKAGFENKNISCLGL